MSFRITGDNHLGFVSSLIHFCLIGAFASMPSLRREYQPFTNNGCIQEIQGSGYLKEKVTPKGIFLLSSPIKSLH